MKHSRTTGIILAVALSSVFVSVFFCLFFVFLPEVTDAGTNSGTSPFDWLCKPAQILWSFFLIGFIAWLNMVYQYAHKTPQYTLNYFLQPRKLLNFADADTIGHVNIGIIFLFIWNSQWCLYNTQSVLIGCSTLSQEYYKLIGLYWRLMRRQLWTLTCPIELLSY